MSDGASALHTSPLSFNPGDVRDRSLLGRGVLTTSPFIAPFCMSVGPFNTMFFYGQPIDNFMGMLCGAPELGLL